MPEKHYYEAHPEILLKDPPSYLLNVTNRINKA
jgi:hypothetical protein